jgi:hypothetical protein
VPLNNVFKLLGQYAFPSLGHIIWEPGVKWPGREVDHSPRRSAEAKNAWSYTSIPAIRLHGVVLY